jgi:hypothetical protein
VGHRAKNIVGQTLDDEDVVGRKKGGMGRERQQQSLHERERGREMRGEKLIKAIYFYYSLVPR